MLTPRKYLPDEILRDIGLGTLNIIKDSFIEKELGEYFSDIIYKVKLNNKDIYLVSERKLGFFVKNKVYNKAYNREYRVGLFEGIREIIKGCS